METAFSAWLTAVFAGFDRALADFAFWLHGGSLGGFFDWLFPAVTALGDGGAAFIVLGVVLLLFPRTRRAGIVVLLALLIGLLVTNLCVKNLVARPRPYADELSVFFPRWQELGHGAEKEIFSFPSGHATAAFGAMTALFWCGNKRYSWTAFFPALLIGFSRVYIYVHFASDIVGGMIAGFAAGTAAYLLVRPLWRRWEQSDRPVAAAITRGGLSLSSFRQKRN